jgi:hypothetical protein
VACSFPGKINPDVWGFVTSPELLRFFWKIGKCVIPGKPLGVYLKYLGKKSSKNMATGK